MGLWRLGLGTADAAAVHGGDPHHDGAGDHPTLVSAAIRPFGRPFKVTDKGGDRSVSTVRWRMAAGFGGIALLSAASIVWSFVSPYGATEISPLDYFNLIWAGVAMLFTFVAFLVCFERPRGAEEFAVEEPVRVQVGGATYAGVLASLGMTTARLRIAAAPEVLAPGDALRVLVEPAGWIAARLATSADGVHAVALEPDRLQRRQSHPAPVHHGGRPDRPHREPARRPAEA